MAAITTVAADVDTTNTTSYAYTAFTPAANDLLVLFVVASDTVDAGSVSSTGNTAAWTKIGSQLYGTGQTMYVFVQNALASAVSTAITFSVPGDAATGAVMLAFRISGMTKTGAAAVRQSAAVANHAAGALVTPTLAAAALTGNPVVEFLGGSENYIAVPTGWTDGIHGTYATPTTEGLYHYRTDFTGTNSGWSDSGSTTFGIYLIEFDASASGATSLIVATRRHSQNTLIRR